MLDRPAALRLGICWLLAFLAFGADDARAQQGALRGVVTDSSGTPIRDADVGLVGLKRLARTDDEGRFAFTKLHPGTVDLSVRRLGFHARIERFVVTPLGVDSVRVALMAQPEVLEAIEVSESERRKRGWIEDFYRRRINGIGTFVTRDEIVARNSFAPSDMLRSTPGVRFVRVPSGKGVRFTYARVMDIRRDCPPLIWVDGQRAPGMEIDDLPLTDIEGIEVYTGPSTTPTQFSQSLSSRLTCGTIAIWTRPPPH